MKNNNIIMTTKELAEYIKIHEKTVIKQVQKGKIPGVKIGNQWRFHLDAIDEYLQGTVLKTPNEDLNQVIKTAEHIIPISRLTDSALIALDVDAKTKEDVLSVIAAIAKDAQIMSSEDEFLDLLKKRESLISTAIGGGVAIPHPRHPVPGMFKKSSIIIVRTKQAIEYDAPDHKKVQLFFAICATNEFVHLRLLAKISKLLYEKESRAQLFSVKDNKELMRILLEFDRRRIFPLFDKARTDNAN